jgi:transcriptional regulator with XRE-family HTH domain
MNNNAYEFWQRVKELIKSQKTTQEWVANTAGVSFNNFKQQIFHNRIPTADEAVGIAKALNTTVEYLVAGESTDAVAELNELKKKVLEFAQSIQ